MTYGEFLKRKLYKVFLSAALNIKLFPRVTLHFSSLLSIGVCLSALSVSEACDWTAVMVISIMPQHPS